MKYGMFQVSLANELISAEINLSLDQRKVVTNFNIFVESRTKENKYILPTHIN